MSLGMDSGGRVINSCRLNIVGSVRKSLRVDGIDGRLGKASGNDDRNVVVDEEEEEEEVK